jgi:rubrerythrin
VLTRRTAIVSGGSALLLAGCGGRPARKLAGDPADLPILGTALELERAQVALYEAALPELDARGAAIARTALAHERAHADALAEAIRELGGTPSPARAAADYARGFPAGRGAAAWRRYAIEFENKAAAGYAAAIPKLANGRLRATFGAIMTAEAEHAAALGLPR